MSLLLICVVMLGGLFKQGLAVVKQNGIPKYLEFSWIFYLDIYFFWAVSREPDAASQQLKDIYLMKTILL